jgi:hypothetical protein
MTMCGLDNQEEPEEHGCFFSVLDTDAAAAPVYVGSNPGLDGLPGVLSV